MSQRQRQPRADGQVSASNRWPRCVASRLSTQPAQARPWRQGPQLPPAGTSGPWGPGLEGSSAALVVPVEGQPKKGRCKRPWADATDRRPVAALALRLLAGWAVLGALAPQPASAGEPRSGSADPPVLATASWVRFLGWSADGTRVAWRSGPQGQLNKPGQPCEIARLDANGSLQDRIHIATEITAALVARRIHSVPLAERQQVTPRDALVQDRSGHLWAGLVRDNLVAILYKSHKAYQPLWKRVLPAAGVSVDLAGFESPTGGLMALIIEARMGRATAAALLVVPTALELPSAASPTQGTQDGATP